MPKPCAHKMTAVERVKRKIQKVVRPSQIPADGFAWTVVPLNPSVDVFVLNENLGFVFTSDVEGQALGLDSEFKSRMRSYWSI